MFPKSRWVRRYVLVMTVLTTATLLAVLSLLAVRPAESVQKDSAFAAGSPPRVLGQIEGFSLTDQTGAPFTDADLRGTVYVTDFIFTSCAGVCPKMTSAMADLYAEFGEEGVVEFVSISVNPERDTPEVLAAYAKRYAASPDTWHFLTGDSGAIQALGRDQFQLGSGDDPLIHSNKFVLVDHQGRIRGYYDGNDPVSIDGLRRDLYRILGRFAGSVGS